MIHKISPSFVKESVFRFVIPACRESALKTRNDSEQVGMTE